MRTIYVCSYCNRQHDTRPKALSCEGKCISRADGARNDFKYAESMQTYYLDQKQHERTIALRGSDTSPEQH